MILAVSIKCGTKFPIISSRLTVWLTKVMFTEASTSPTIVEDGGTDGTQPRDPFVVIDGITLVPYLLQNLIELLPRLPIHFTLSGPRPAPSTARCICREEERQ